MSLEPLVSSNLNDGVAESLRDRILQGVFDPGQRLNEVALAAQLGVSRTPVREALNRLVVEGAVEVRPRFGYAIRPLSLAEFEGLYDIRPILDVEALRISGRPTEQILLRLSELNDQLRNATDPVERVDLDDAWHLLLLAACPNATLIELINLMMKRTRRYELAYLKDAGHAMTAADLHTEIVEALKAADIPRACDKLRENLSNGKPAIKSWLEARLATEEANR